MKYIFMAICSADKWKQNVDWYEKYFFRDYLCCRQTSGRGIKQYNSKGYKYSNNRLNIVQSKFSSIKLVNK